MAPQAADAGAGDELAVVQLDPLEVVAGNLGKKGSRVSVSIRDLKD